MPSDPVIPTTKQDIKGFVAGAMIGAADMAATVKKIADKSRVESLEPRYRPEYKSGSYEAAIFCAGMACAAKIIEDALKLAAEKLCPTES